MSWRVQGGQVLANRGQSPVRKKGGLSGLRTRAESGKGVPEPEAAGLFSLALAACATSFYLVTTMTSKVLNLTHATLKVEMEVIGEVIVSPSL